MNNPIFMQNGWVVYPKRGLPPPDMEGYRRKGTNPKAVDSFIFIPAWQQACTFRVRSLVLSNLACKCPRIVTKCTHPESAIFGEVLTMAKCENCQLRNVQLHESLVELSPCDSVSESVVVVEQGDSEVLAEGREAEIAEGSWSALEDSPIIESDSE